MSKVTVREASLLTGKSRETINNATKDGSLSYTLNGKNHKVIDVAELSRVYEIVKTPEEIEKEKLKSKTVRPSQILSEDDSQEWKTKYVEAKTKLEAMQEKIELVEKHNNKERHIYEDQIDNLKDSLKLAQEGHNKATILLEHKSSDSDKTDWEKSLKAMESRISNQEKSVKEEKELTQKILRQNQSLKRALDAEKNKSFWKKLFG